jgi:hypothetical protein
MKASKITAVDFFDDLTSPYARRRFLWAFLLLCALCAIFIYLTSQFIPHEGVRLVLTDIFTKVISDATVIIVFYWVYIYFIGTSTLLTEVAVTRSQDISEQIKSLPLKTGNYIFWGRSGSFFRAYTLLELDRHARELKKVIDIEILLPDSTDQKLVESYNDIIRTLGETSNKNTLLINVLATCMACAIVSANNKFIKIKLFKSRFLPAFRVDIADQGAILTQDDPKKAALFFQAGSEFYEMFKTTVRNEMSISTEINWGEALFKGLSLDEKSCYISTINAFGISVDNISEIQLEVGRLIAQRPHRYK